MKKKILEFIRGTIYVFLIIHVAGVYLAEGKREALSFYSWQNKITFIQEPPTIMSNCYSTCEKVERVTWEEYVRRYQERMKPQ